MTYQLFKPNDSVKEQYMWEAKLKLCVDNAVLEAQHEHLSQPMVRVAGHIVVPIVAKRLINKVLWICRKHAGSLLSTVRKIEKICINNKVDLVRCNTMPPLSHSFMPLHTKYPTRGNSLSLQWIGKENGKVIVCERKIYLKNRVLHHLSIDCHLKVQHLKVEIALCSASL